MRTIIKNGTLVYADKILRSDLEIIGDKITDIGVNISAGIADDTTQVIDATNKFVLPGGIDAHTHLALPVFMPDGDTYSSDDYYTGTVAAACGGITTVFDFATQDKGERLIDTLKRRDMLAVSDAVIDYAFHIAITDIKDKSPSELENEISEVVRAGVSCIKAYMVYDFSLSDDELLSLMIAAKRVNALVAIHAEDKAELNKRVNEFKQQCTLDTWHHYLSRPEDVETAGIKRALELAKQADAPIYIVHVASAGAIEAVRIAQSKGQSVFAETCPQYLHFTNDVYIQESGRYFVCSPPIKGIDSKKALWDAVNDGTISTIATDHCPFKTYEKDWGSNDFTRIPNGIMGVETIYPFMLDHANRGHISFNKAVELCSTNPARIFGIAPNKGSLDLGSDADIVIYNPSKPYTVTRENMHSACDYTIWEGLTLSGSVEKTISRGRIVFDNGVFVGKKGFGKRVQ